MTLKVIFIIPKGYLIKKMTTHGHHTRFPHYWMLVVFCIIFIITILSSSQVFAIYIELFAGKSVCFTEDLPPNTSVFIEYAPPSSVMLSTIVVRDPFGSVVLEERDFTTADHSHKTQFTTKGDISGQHEICIVPTQISQDLSYKQQVFARVVIEANKEHVEKDMPESKEHVEKLDKLLQGVSGRIEAITYELIYLKERESRFRITTDSTFDRTWYLGITKFTLLIIVTVWQMTNLRMFFKKKKLI